MLLQRGGAFVMDFFPCEVYWKKPLDVPRKSSLVAKNNPKSFSVVDWVMSLLLKIHWDWNGFWILWENTSSWTCLLESVWKIIFHWNYNDSSYHALLKKWMCHWQII